MANVWTYWKCTSCDSVIRGDCRECPKCGAPIPGNVKYMMPDNPEIVKAVAEGKVFTKEDIVQKAVTYVEPERERKQPNWKCEYCGYQNRFEDTTCVSCGAGKEEAKEDYFGNRPVMDSKNKQDYENRTGTAYVSPPEPTKPVLEPTVPEPLPEKTSLVNTVLEFFKNNWKILSGAVLGVLAVIFLIWLFTPIQRVSTIQRFGWERSIQVEKFTECHESDWNLPPGAKLERTAQEIHHYEKVLDHVEHKSRQVSEQVQDGYDIHYRDLGNGQAEEVKTPRYKTVTRTEYYDENVYRQEPVYRTKYYYEIGRWKKAESLNSAGADQNPYWHDTTLPENIGNPVYGDKRLGDRKERYYAVILDDKEQFQEVNYSQSEWEQHTVGEEITYKTFRFSQKPL